MAKTYYSDEIGLPPSDRSRWRLRITELGATSWHYLSEEEAKSDPQNNCTKYCLKMDDFEAPPAEDIVYPIDSARKGGEFFSLTQDESGVVPNMYVGPMFMTTGLVSPRISPGWRSTRLKNTN